MKYFKTKLKGISISRTGSVQNTKTGKTLKVTKRGYFTFSGKPISLPKIMMETFSKIPIRSGQINFIDGNNQNFDIDNIEYKTKLTDIKPPDENDILKILRFYYGSKVTFNIKDVFRYRMFLKIILKQRNFFDMNSNQDNILIFKDYFSIDMPSYLKLSKRHNITVRDAQRTIYLFLNKLIEDFQNELKSKH